MSVSSDAWYQLHVVRLCCVAMEASTTMIETDGCTKTPKRAPNVVVTYFPQFADVTTIFLHITEYNISNVVPIIAILDMISIQIGRVRAQ